MATRAQRTAISRSIRLGDGRTIHLRDWPGRARPLVLLHGLLDSSAGWEDLACASRRRCLAIDLPGFGLSSPPERALLTAYAEDVAEALARLEIGSCTLVGHSLGGGVATALAELLPGEIAALVLCAPAGFGPLALAQLACLPLVGGLAVNLLPRLLANPLCLDALYGTFVTSRAAPSEDLRGRLAAEAGSVGPGLRAAIETLADAGQSSRAFHRRPVRYSGPVFAVWGDRDALVPPAHARGVASALPQAQLQLWPGMGHHPQRERPHALAFLVEEASRARGHRPLSQNRAPVSIRRRTAHTGDAPELKATRRQP
jgi:pimeloyl-ACP methyl ester carboxylesterase